MTKVLRFPRRWHSRLEIISCARGYTTRAACQRQVGRAIAHARLFQLWFGAAPTEQERRVLASTFDVTPHFFERPFRAERAAAFFCRRWLDG